MAATDKKISPKEFVLIRDMIKERTGIFIRDSRSDYLEYRLMDRMIATGIQSFEEYYYYLKYAQASGEFQALINLITVPETSFFRNPEQLKSFRDVILKDMLAKKTKSLDRGLKIWSAACATGEEPLTLAMIVSDAIAYPFNWEVEILATDISTKVLDIAGKGFYEEYRLMDIPQNIRDKYFFKTKGGYRAGESLSGMIRYLHLNLTRAFDDSSPVNLYKFDVIFCRNIFIYFTDDVKERIANGFYAALKPGGYLFLGNAETIDIRKVPFKMTFLPGGLVYQKP